MVEIYRDSLDEIDFLLISKKEYRERSDTGPENFIAARRIKYTDFSGYLCVLYFIINWIYMWFRANMSLPKGNT